MLGEFGVALVLCSFFHLFSMLLTRWGFTSWPNQVKSIYTDKILRGNFVSPYAFAYVSICVFGTLCKRIYVHRDILVSTLDYHLTFFYLDVQFTMQGISKERQGIRMSLKLSKLASEKFPNSQINLYRFLSVFDLECSIIQHCCKG